MTQKSVDKEKMNIIMILCAHRCLQTTIDYCGIAHPCHNLKSGLPIKAVFHFRYIISLFIQQQCQIIARKIEISSILLINQIFYLFIY